MRAACSIATFIVYRGLAHQTAVLGKAPVEDSQFCLEEDMLPWETGKRVKSVEEVETSKWGVDCTTCTLINHGC